MSNFLKYMSTVEFSSDAFYKTSINSLACTYYFSIILLQSRSNTLFKGKISVWEMRVSSQMTYLLMRSKQIYLSVYLYLSIYLAYIPNTIYLLTYLPIINQLFTYLYLPTQSLTCLTLSDCTDCSLQISLHGNFQARILEQVAISSSWSLTQGLNLHLQHFLHPQVDSLPLHHLGSPYTTYLTHV